MPADRVKHRPASLTWRVTAFVGIATTVVFFAFGWLVVRSLEQHFAQQDAEEFKVVVESIQQALRDQPAGPDNAAWNRLLMSSVVGYQKIFFRVTDAAGKSVHATTGGPDLARLVAAAEAAPQINPESLQVWREGDKSYRGVVLRLQVNQISGSGIYTVAVATNMDFHLRYTRNFERTLWLTTLVVCLIALLAAWLAVRQGHAPLRKISAKIRGISSERLHVRLKPEAVPIELAGLVASFNDMLERIEAGFGKLSNFSADIAHELRTPVTNLTTQTQVALGQTRSADEYREVLYSSLEEFERMGKMIGDMLFLAKAENDQHGLELVDVDIAHEVKGLFDYYEAWAEDREVSLKCEGYAAPVKANPPMLRRALGNLLTNAIRYTPRGSAVTVKLSASAQSTVICVQNPGEEIASVHLLRLFDRFYRVDPARQHKGEGAGLGLAIVKSIVESHQGVVRVASKDSMTRFEIELPNHRETT